MITTRLVAMILCGPLAMVAAQCAPVVLSTGGVPGAWPGSVTATVLWDPDGAGPLPPDVAVGGDFEVIGSVQAHIALWHPGTGEWSALAQGTSDRVTDLVVMPNGDLVAVGAFTMAGGAPANHVARWDGVNWSAIGAGTAHIATAAHVTPAGELLVGHGDSSLLATPWNGAVERWDGAAWNTLGTFYYGWSHGVIHAITTLQNGDIVVGGEFSTAAGMPVNNIARCDGVSWSALGAGFHDRVEAFAVRANGDLIAGGEFYYGSFDRIARWNGTAWSAMPPPPGGAVRHLMNLGNGELLAGADPVGAQSSGTISVWSGSVWQSLSGSGLFAMLTGVELPNGDLLAAGGRAVTGRLAGALEVWNGSTWSALGAGLDDRVTAITVARGEIVVAGLFRTVHGAPADYAAKWDGAAFAPLGAGPGGLVTAMTTMPNGDVVMSGGMHPSTGGAGAAIVRWDGAQWLPLDSGLRFYADALLPMPNGDLIAGGSLSLVGQNAPERLARFDGASWTGFGALSANGSIKALALDQNGDLLVGGDFTSIDAVPARNIARWDGTNFHPLGGGVGGPGIARVRSIAVSPSGDVVVGGTFTGNIARWDGFAWTVPGAGLDAEVRTVAALPNGDVMAGGRFSTGGGLARWDGASWASVGQGVNASVFALHALPGGELGVGGDFTVVDGTVSAYFARLSTTCPASAAPIVTSCVGTAGPVTLASDNLPWVGSTFRSTATGFTSNVLAVSLLGLTSPNVPLTWVWPNTLANCNQLASQEAILLHLPQAGSTHYSFAILNSVAFAGVNLFHQFLQFELTPQGNLGPLSSSNGLHLTIGAF